MPRLVHSMDNIMIISTNPTVIINHHSFPPTHINFFLNFVKGNYCASDILFSNLISLIFFMHTRFCVRTSVNKFPQFSFLFIYEYLPPFEE